MLKRVPLGSLGERPNIAAMILDDLTDDGQAQASAVFLGGKLWFEYLRARLRRQTAAVIGHFNVTTSRPHCKPLDSSDLTVIPAHRRHRVVEQIDQTRLIWFRSKFQRRNHPRMN